MPAETVLAWWRGHPAGWWNPAEYRVASITVPIATHVPHAVGLAWGKRLRGEPTCAIAYFGDGATSEARLHEGANFAAVMDAPAILPCNNNGWAIDAALGSDAGSRSRTRRSAAGVPVRVDGGDVLAVFEATRDAALRARAGDGPTFIEAGDVPDGAARNRRRPERVHRRQLKVDASARTSAWSRFERYLRRLGLLDDASSRREEARGSCAPASRPPRRCPIPIPARLQARLRRAAAGASAMTGTPSSRNNDALRVEMGDPTSW